MSYPFEIADVQTIADNDHYSFCVGRCGDRWLGFATESVSARKARLAFTSEGLPTEPGMAFILPEVADGFVLGVLDRQRAILLTGAIAQDPESAYGGVARWFVPPELRGTPCRCLECGEINGHADWCQDAIDTAIIEDHP